MNKLKDQILRLFEQDAARRTASLSRRYLSLQATIGKRELIQAILALERYQAFEVPAAIAAKTISIHIVCAS